MRIFNLSTGADTAGISIATKAAFARQAPDWTVHSMVANQNYIRYPLDVPWSQAGLEGLYDAADVVHIHNTLHAHRWYDAGQGKPTVLMHHGIHSLAEFREIAAEARAAKIIQVGSTLDLALLEPDIEWLPAPANLDALRAIRRAHYRTSDVVRIGHAPTQRAIKGSDTFDRVVATLIAEGLPVEPVVIQRLPWDECLRRKATVDLMFDQPVLGYGSNSVEAWAMGIPVVSGVADSVIRAGMIERWGRLPFYEANEQTLLVALRTLVLDPALRAEYAAIGTAHVERWHDERVTVESLQRIYAATGPSVPGGSQRRNKVTAVTYEPVAHWQNAGRNPAARDHESRFRRSAVFEHQEERLMALLETLEFRSILELGCGWGRITKLVHERWPEKPYRAIDLSADAIASAKRKVTGVEFSQSTIQDFEPTEKWDLVLAVETLMHVQPTEIEAVVEKLLRFSSHHVVSLDWSLSLGNKAIAPWNFRHDYAAIYGARLAVEEQIGLQSIYHAQVLPARRINKRAAQLVPA